MRDGKLVKVETGPHPDSRYTAACVRCLAIPKWVYSPERLQHPLKRVGNRGEGKFERISWDEAIETIASSSERRSTIATDPAASLSRGARVSQGGGYARIASLLQASNLYGGVDMAVHMGLNAMFGNRGMFGQNTNEWTDLPNAEMIIAGATIRPRRA